MSFDLMWHCGTTTSMLMVIVIVRPLALSSVTGVQKMNALACHTFVGLFSGAASAYQFARHDGDAMGSVDFFPPVKHCTAKYRHQNSCLFVRHLRHLNPPECWIVSMTHGNCARTLSVSVPTPTPTTTINH